jgi:hypothetical protein
MLTATYLTDVIGLRPEFRDYIDRGALDAPSVIAAGSHARFDFLVIPGSYSSPTAVIRPGEFGT